jgi:branched-chain amino acid transport system substrate-binding protein
VFTYGYYTAMTGLIKGLEAAGGEVGDQTRLQEELAKVTLTGEEAPWGDVKLDENRQAVSDVYVKRIVRDKTGDGVTDVETFRRIPEVDQTFGGFFKPSSPALDRQNPQCKKSDPPPWVGNAERVSFGQ